MASNVETIWDYLELLGYEVVPRTEKKTVHLALESDKLNGAQKKRLQTRLEWSEKLDGVFSLVTVLPTEQGLRVRHWGRSGKAMSNLGHLDALVEVSLHTPSEPIILISEVTCDNPLAKLSGFVNPNRVNEDDWYPDNLQDNFHDIITFDEFIQGESEMTYHYRQLSLKRALHDSGLNIIPSQGYWSLENARVIVKDIWGVGGEGMVGRDIHSHWVAGARNETMIKLKEKLSFDVTVVGVCSGKEGTKYEGTLGKLIVFFRAFGEADGEPLWVPISGMTDKQRDEWYEHPERIIGATVKMDAKSFTDTGNLREPRYKETRHDKGSDFPCTILKETKEFTKGKANHMIHELEID